MANHRHCLMFASENSTDLNGLKTFDVFLAGSMLANRMVRRSRGSPRGLIMVSESRNAGPTAWFSGGDAVAGVVTPATLLQKRMSLGYRRMHLQTLALREINQVHTCKYHMVPLT